MTDAANAPNRVEDVLYVVSLGARDRIQRELVAAGGQIAASDGTKQWIVLNGKNPTFRFSIVDSIAGTREALQHHYFNFIVVDNRFASPTAAREQTKPFPVEVIEQIHYAADPELRFPRSRIIAVLSEDRDLSAISFQLGRLQIGGIVLHPFPDRLTATLAAMHRAAPGKSALCLSGGGVEGFLFELGVVKAIDAHLQGQSAIDFDIFCGISSGSILAAFLANRVTPAAVEGALLGDEKNETSELVQPSTIFDPHYGEYLSRLMLLGSNVTRNRGSEFFSQLLKTVPIGFFRGSALQKFVATQLNRPGRTDDFRQLQRELYIGATDQDTSSHVLFGQGEWNDVPISTAVRASTALTPFFEPAKIRGRYFVDGQYTRTSNFHAAIERGARLIIIIDPLVPLRSDQPGYVRKKGGVFGGLQALKAVIHTRFMHVFQSAVEAYPEVDFVLFSPEADVMRIMSGSPMKYHIRTEIINLAFRYAVSKIQRDFVVLEGVFARHGLTLQRHPRLKSPHRAIS